MASTHWPKVVNTSVEVIMRWRVWLKWTWEVRSEVKVVHVELDGLLEFHRTLRVIHEHKSKIKEKGHLYFWLGSVITISINPEQSSDSLQNLAKK